MEKITKRAVKSFLENDLKNSLEAEINSYIRLNKCHHETADDVITYNETAMLSLVKSALIREKKSDNVWGIQEYSVYDNESYSTGRADAFFMFREEDFMCDILFEAKRMGRYSKNRRFVKIDWGTYMRDTQQQGEKYFKAEQRYFSEPTFVITIFFEELDEEDFETYNDIEDVSWKDSLVYTFYLKPQGSKKMLAVYGHIKQKK